MAIKEENLIGQRIVRAFNAKDLKEVAQTIDENYSSLHNWSSKRRDFPTNVLIKIAKMTNTSIDWILTGEETFSTEVVNFEKLFERKIREIVRQEISEGSEIHEKVQGILLAMKSNVKEQFIFENADSGKEEKAA